VQFSPAAVEVLYRATAGVPRLINRICDRALHHGYLRRVGTIDEHMLEAAIEDAGHFATAPPPVAVAVPATTPSRAPAAAPLQASVPHAAVTPLAPPPPVTVPPAGFDAPVDEWLAIMEADVEATRRAKAGKPVHAPLGPDVPRRDRRVPTAAVDREPAVRYVPRTVPPTHAQRFVNRWARRLALAAMIAIGTPVAAIAGLALWNVSTDMWELAAPLPLPPVPAPLPRVVAPPYELPPLPEITADAPGITAPQ
jgi:hypothetical protein